MSDPYDSRPVIVDIVRSFRPGTLGNELSLASVLLSTTALVTAATLKVFEVNEEAANALGICAITGLVGGITQSRGMVALASLGACGLGAAASISYGLGTHTWLHLGGGVNVPGLG